MPARSADAGWAGVKPWSPAELVLPIVTLTALLVYGFGVLRLTNIPADNGSLRIEVVGEQYWWRVRYLPEAAEAAFTTANELQVPIGRRIELIVTSADVIHAIWIPNFAGKVDMIPGRVTRLTFTAEEPGVYRGQCTEFCGDQHARMAFDVVALEPAAFDAWRRQQAEKAQEPATDFLERGRTLFFRNGCGNCHAVRGTRSEGAARPRSDPRRQPPLDRRGAASRTTSARSRAGSPTRST